MSPLLMSFAASAAVIWGTDFITGSLYELKRGVQEKKRFHAKAQERKGGKILRE
jgi:hypothetical protein